MTNLSRSEFARQIGINRVTLWRLEQSGTIPPAVRRSGSRSEFSPAAQIAIRAFVGAAA